jgi:hypothetical protein
LITRQLDFKSRHAFDGILAHLVHNSTNVLFVNNEEDIWPQSFQGRSKGEH